MGSVLAAAGQQLAQATQVVTPPCRPHSAIPLCSIRSCSCRVKAALALHARLLRLLCCPGSRLLGQ